MTLFKELKKIPRKCSILRPNVTVCVKSRLELVHCYLPLEGSRLWTFSHGGALTQIQSRFTPKSSLFDRHEHNQSVLWYHSRSCLQRVLGAGSCVCKKGGSSCAKTRKWAAVIPLHPLCYTMHVEIGKVSKTVCLKNKNIQTRHSNKADCGDVFTLVQRHTELL